MLRLGAIILCLGLVCGAHGFQLSTATEYQPGDTVDLDCGSKTLIIDNAVLFLDGECQSTYGDLRTKIDEYCTEKSACSFSLADLFGSPPESCIEKFEVGEICL